MSTFRTYDLAVRLYRASATVELPGFLKTQLRRAASSIALNLQEGNGRSSRAERRKFFTIAYGSLREVQSIVELEPKDCASIASTLDQLGASLYCLRKALE